MKRGCIFLAKLSRDIGMVKSSIEYMMDTKGFYQPVYSFTSIIDGNEYSIIIPAINWYVD